MSADDAVRYGSDVMVDVLARLGIEHLAINPGATLRGLHESLVRAGKPELLLTLHENVAVGMAHGYAKATGRPMGVALHNLVGLQTGSMALFNAFLDLVPMLVVGGSGPADAARRRPWIDWIHASRDQAAQVRAYTKWDDQPAGLDAAVHSLARAHSITTAFPQAPVYVALDAGLQEDVVSGEPRNALWSPATALARQSTPTVADADLLPVAEALAAAERPLLLADTAGRSEAAYRALVALAERLGAGVVDLGARHNFPNTHWADRTQHHHADVAEADVILAVDVRDPYFALGRTDVANRDFAWLPRPGARVFVLSGAALIERAPLDRAAAAWDRVEAVLTGDAAVALPRLAEIVAELPVPGAAERTAALRATASGPAVFRERLSRAPGAFGPARLAAETFEAVRGGAWQLAFGALYGNSRRAFDMDEFNCYLGISGGGGLGYGVPAALGAALAHRHDDTLVVDIQPDGDFLYTAQALWTAAHERLPLLVVMANNRTYNQDRMHQTEIGHQRGRDTDVAAGIDITGPDVDFATLARSQGVEGIGPVTDAAELPATLARAARIVREERRPVLVDAVMNRDRS
ncbi:thiamine pyrophosphate-binding protein [Dactylosporangium maewongense]|uniref:Thiamine pyrophosphate-binding protein n=1 Tax=Dactylosporangium maewongense TaxID=634393 RepID=A0ABN1ZPN4_9ACTN